MDRFFGLKYSGEAFSVFSTVHMMTLLFLVITNFLILFILMKMKNPKAAKILRLSIASIMLFHFISYEAWSFLTGDFTLKYSLPLHLCDIGILFSAIMLFTKNKFLFEITYFWGLGGSLLAILTPDIFQSFPHFIFMNYFLSHGGIITSVLFMIFIEKYRVTFKSIRKVFLFTNVYMVIIAGVNLLLKSNYLYICRKPNNPTLIDFLGPWPWYLLNLEVVTVTVFLLLFIPFSLKRSPSKNTPMDFSA